MELLYKATDKCSFCIKMQYTVGELHKYEGPIKICYSGFHACRNLAHVFEYYTRPAEIYVCEGNVVDEEDDKVVCDEIRLIRQVTVQELLGLDQEDWRVRFAIARHPEVTLKTLEKLADDGHAEVRKAVASNHKTTDKMLEKFANDSIWWVRLEVVRHPKVTQRMLKELASYNSWLVREEIAAHPKATVETLKILAEDHDYDIRLAAQERLKEYGETI